MPSAGQSWGKWKPKKGRKLTAAEIPGALAAHERAQEVSDLIRLTIGPWTASGELPEHRRVPENQSVAGWRASLNGSPKRQPKATKSAPKVAAPGDPLAALRAAVRARGEAEAAVSAALVSVREAGGSMTKAAAALGVSRQAAYKALERASA